MKTKPLLAAALLALAAGSAWAQDTPVGLWKTIDDDTKKEKSLVRIADERGTLTGRIEKLLDPTKQDAKCDACTDGRKGLPIAGLTIIDGVRKNPSEAYWDGGTILDPANGKTYKVRLTPKDGGKTLEVRGFIGFLYRNQIWQRVE